MSEVETLKQQSPEACFCACLSASERPPSNSSDLSEAAIDRLVDETVSMASLTSEDDSGGLPDHSLVRDTTFPNLDLLDSQVGTAVRPSNASTWPCERNLHR
jgi:hypothetical protein